MSKRFKLKFPNIPSFQICRLKNPISFPKNPKPANYRRSPVNPKALDITFPSPQTKQENPYVSRRDSSKSARKIIRSTSSDGCDRSHFDKGKKKKKKALIKPSHVFTLVSDEDEDDDSLILLDSSRNFSSEQYPTAEIHRRQRSPPKRAAERERNDKAILSGKTARESVAFVKKSEDPYEDFKKSMVEMIMEKQIFEATDLEELLQCFLTLNSKQYHGIIVEAFSEIWGILFADHDSHDNSHRHSF